MMPIARSVDRNLKFTLVQSSLACPLSPPWTVSNRYMITPVGPGLVAATQREGAATGGLREGRADGRAENPMIDGVCRLWLAQVVGKRCWLIYALDVGCSSIRGGM